MNAKASLGAPSPRTGRLYSGDQLHVIPDEAMALTWAADPPLWYLINDQLDLLADEYEEDDLTPDQAVAAAGIIRVFAAGLPDLPGLALRNAADFLEIQGRNNRTVQVAL